MENWTKKIHVGSSLPAKDGQYAMFVGRWQPLHPGHQELFKQAMDEGKNVLICIRDIAPDEKNPFAAEEVRHNIMEHYSKECEEGKYDYLGPATEDDFLEAMKLLTKRNESNI